MYIEEVAGIQLSSPELLENFYETGHWISTLNLFGGAFYFGSFNIKLKYFVFKRDDTLFRKWAHDIEVLFLRLCNFYLENDLDTVNSDSWI
jgi:hypothetical protein